MRSFTRPGTTWPAWLHPDAQIDAGTNFRQVLGFDGDVLIHRDKVLTLITNLGIGVLLFDASDAATPADFCQQGS